MLTANEKRILRFLMGSFSDYSINEIAKKCGLSPNGAYKILKKFEREGILKSFSIANIKSYRLNFEDEKTFVILKLILIPELEGRLKYRLDDLKELKEVTKSCILFGSYTDLKKKPNDLDVLFVLNKENYKKYKIKLRSIINIIPVKVHDVIQTEKDLKKNIVKRDKVILNILKNGIVLWGQDVIIKVIADVYKRKT